MCDNAAKTLCSNHLKHIARSTDGAKKLWGRACSGRRSDESGVAADINVD